MHGIMEDQEANFLHGSVEKLATQACDENDVTGRNIDWCDEWLHLHKHIELLLNILQEKEN